MDTKSKSTERIYSVGEPHESELCECPEAIRKPYVYRRAKLSSSGFWGCANWSMRDKGCGSVNERTMKQRTTEKLLSQGRLSQSIVQTRSFWEPTIFFPPIDAGSPSEGVIAHIKEPTLTNVERQAMSWISRYCENLNYIDADHRPMSKSTSCLWVNNYLMVHFQSAAVRHYCQYDMIIQTGPKRHRAHIQPLWFKEWCAIELSGFKGQDHIGWLYGDADFVMFQLAVADSTHPNGSWLMVDLGKLRIWFHDRNFAQTYKIKDKSWAPHMHMTTDLPEQFITNFDMPEHVSFDTSLINLDHDYIYRGGLTHGAFGDDYMFIHVSKIESFFGNLAYKIESM